MILKKIILIVIVLFVLITIANFLPRLLHGRCIVKGARIATPTGDVLIENVRIHDAIWTQGPTGRIEKGVVVDRRELAADRYLSLRLSDGTTLNATAEHPIATPEDWRAAGALCVGDALVTRKGTVTIAAIVTQNERVQVYDLTVSPNPNFFANGVLVHNKSLASPTAAAAKAKAVAEAQAIYYRNDYDKDGVQDYAQSLGDLLETKPGAQDLFLIDPSIENKGKPSAGYFIRILTAQGEHAKGGKMSYIENGNMTRGFAILAYPGVPDFTTAFILNHDGVMYLKDFREEDREQLQKITEFDPDTSWTRAE